MTESVSGYDLTSVRGHDNERPAAGKDRVRKHRDKMRAHGCSRLDLWVEGDLFDHLCTLAEYRHVTLRQIIQESFKDTVGKYAGVLEVLKRHRAV
jgi:hypothetical protein